MHCEHCEDTRLVPVRAHDGSIVDEEACPECTPECDPYVMAFRRDVDSLGDVSFERGEAA